MWDRSGCRSRPRNLPLFGDDPPLRSATLACAGGITDAREWHRMVPRKTDLARRDLGRTRPDVMARSPIADAD